MVKKKTASVKLKWRSRSSRGKVEVKILTTETDMEAASSRNQPTRGILEGILRELCVYNGHARSYELKPEYKNTGEEDTTDAH
ncbi:unnamed protein product [Microthlaspi erraticum]|uniref:Uncharacterized protein n=1 Tax=Microthlaspi erraticum TaxID=1685480 RepID=A0A6D2HEE3_9BRAS|nr:unnamed protein product [Microthlaspi erraticum]